MYKRIYENKEKVSLLGTNQKFLLQRIKIFLQPFTNYLTTLMDVRLVRTFHDAFVGILSHRDRANCLLLSELGGYIAGFLKATSGTKRLSNLFRSERWTEKDIEEVRLKRTKEQVSIWQKEGRRVLGFIDDSRLEKPESWFSEGLCAVYSSKAQRLTRIKRGYYRPPIKRICVPGYEWTALMIGGLSLIPMLGIMKWWTTRGEHKDSQDNVLYKLLKQIKSVFDSTLTLVLDRGFANLPTLEKLFKCQQSFIIRWKGANLLTTTVEAGNPDSFGKGIAKNTWRICFGKKGFDKRAFWDKERKMTHKLEIIYAPVCHPEYPDKPLNLIVVRQKTIKGQQPMYLLTDCIIDSVGIAWELFRSYIQRWDIEQAFRFNKSELGIQSLRLRDFEDKLKMLALVTLIYEFLLQLWRNWHTAAFCIINKWCHRTDKRLQLSRLPLYRLRLAIVNCLTLLIAILDLPDQANL
jgi:hypothetical protein